jgi:hypothetical protein
LERAGQEVRSCLEEEWKSILHLHIEFVCLVLSLELTDCRCTTVIPRFIFQNEFHILVFCARDRLGCKFVLFIVLLARHGGLKTIGGFKLRFKLRSIGELFDINLQMPGEVTNTLRICTHDADYWGLASCSPRRYGFARKGKPTNTSPHLSPPTPTFRAYSSRVHSSRIFGLSLG